MLILNMKHQAFEDLYISVIIVTYFIPWYVLPSTIKIEFFIDHKVKHLNIILLRHIIVRYGVTAGF